MVMVVVMVMVMVSEFDTRRISLMPPSHSHVKAPPVRTNKANFRKVEWDARGYLVAVSGSTPWSFSRKSSCVTHAVVFINPLSTRPHENVV